MRDGIAGTRTRLVIALGGRRDPRTSASIADGTTPDVEFEYLLTHTDAKVIDFAALESTAVRRTMSRVLGPYWTAALISVKEHDATVVVIASGEDLGFRMALAHRVLRSRRRRPLITMVCHGSYLGSGRASVAMSLLRSLDNLRFLGLSESIARQFREVYGFAACQVGVVGYGIDTAFFAPEAGRVESTTPATSTVPRIASAGLASRDYPTLIEAVRGLEVEVKIAADSAWFRAADGIDRSNVPANVEARSYCDYVGLRDLYASADIVVVPLHQGRHAAGYAVIAEAMAMGKPVISTDIIGRSDFIVDGDTGVLVPPGDVAALRDSITRLLDDPEAALEMGRRARLHIEQHDSVAAYADRILTASLDRPGGLS